MANPFENTINPTDALSLSKTAKFMARVYGWMMLGIAMSGIVAYELAQNTTLALEIATNRAAIWGIFLVQLALVIAIPRVMGRLSSSTVGLLYFFYSAVTGVTLSFIFLAYTQSSIAGVFFTTAIAFAGLSATGYLTKRDLGPIGSFCMMAVWGLIGYSLLAIFVPALGGESGSFGFSLVGLLVFSGLTAYNTQKIKSLYNGGFGSEEASRKLAIFGALILYIDFVNLFLSLLRLTGSRRR